MGKTPQRWLLDVYDRALLTQPLLTWVAAVALVTVFATFLRDYQVEASQNSLVLRSDPDLNFYNESRRDWETDEYVMVAVEIDDLFTPAGVDRLVELRDEMLAIDGVDQVTSILDVPLMVSPPPDMSGRSPLDRLATLMAVLGDPVTLTDPACDLEMARAEVTESAIFSDNLIDRAGTTTTLLVYLWQDPDHVALEAERDVLRVQVIDAGGNGQPVDPALSAQLLELEAACQPYIDRYESAKSRIVDEIRATGDEFSELYDTRVYYSGMPLIVGEMVRYLEEDTERFLVGALLLLALLLGAVFRRLRWVVLPLVTGMSIVAVVTGAMVVAGIKPTIVTAYITVLLFIVAMAHSIHIVVRHRELQVTLPALDARTRIRRTVSAIAVPCLYTALTTCVGFASLIVCDIAPVIEFGKVMAWGVMAALALSFVLMPAAILLFGEPAAPRTILARRRVRTAEDTAVLLRERFPLDDPPQPTSGRFRSRRKKARKLRVVDAPMLAAIAWFTRKARWPIALVAAGLFVYAAAGIVKLQHETRFLDYFDKRTLIHRGLEFIDTQMGGTTTLEVILTAPAGEDGRHFFLDPNNIERVRHLSKYFESDPACGKAVSIVNFVDEANKLRDRDERINATIRSLALMRKDRNPGKQIVEMLPQGVVEVAYPDDEGRPRSPEEVEWRVQRFVAALVLAGLPEEDRRGYVDAEFRVARIVVRMHETARDLDRRDIIDRVRHHLATDAAYNRAGWTASAQVVGGPAGEPERAGDVRSSPGTDTDGAGVDEGPPMTHEVTGIFLLYANMLDSLVESQLEAIGWVFLGIFLMLWALFRSLRLAILGILPNVLPVVTVLGVMGYAGVPLDMMTIMIASVSMGIAVDGTIHYIVRFRRELEAIPVDDERSKADAYHHALNRTHTSIGVAIFYTAVSVCVGFAVLTMSNFLPTIRFGMLTSLAMLTSLFGSLTLLPASLLIMKPLRVGPKKKKTTTKPDVAAESIAKAARKAGSPDQ